MPGVVVVAFHLSPLAVAVRPHMRSRKCLPRQPPRPSHHQVRATMPPVLSSVAQNSRCRPASTTKDSHQSYHSFAQQIARNGFLLASIAVLLFTVVCAAAPQSANATHQITAASAAAAASSPSQHHHHHIGHRIARSLQSLGLPDMLVLAAISALPVVELRGGIPVGYWMGLHPLQVLAVCVVGNCVPAVLLLVSLRSRLVEQLLAPFLTRARSHVGDLSQKQSPLAALAVFVGVPFPGTGAWTGAFVAHVLALPLWPSAVSVCAGVCMSGLIMTALCLLGIYGALAVAAVVFGAALMWLVRAVSSASHTRATDSENAHTSSTEIEQDSP
mmetsp:Transcript_1605/g.3409  ORF Transcript_1605/g.3409 Transcript_1605/m.3409 type:complete len:330 (+) Transcript_1605:276-1265(+)